MLEEDFDTCWLLRNHVLPAMANTNIAPVEKYMFGSLGASTPLLKSMCAPIALLPHMARTIASNIGRVCFSTKIAKKYITENPYIATATFASRGSLLMIAIEQAPTSKITRWLAEFWATDVNVGILNEGHYITPLEHAVRLGLDQTFIDSLVGRGAVIRDPEFAIGWHVVAGTDAQSIQRLLAYGLKIPQLFRNKTVLGSAWPRLDVFELLLKCGADPNVCDCDRIANAHDPRAPCDMRIFGRALGCRSLEHVRLLLEAGVDETLCTVICHDMTEPRGSTGDMQPGPRTEDYNSVCVAAQ